MNRSRRFANALLIIASVGLASCGTNKPAGMVDPDGDPDDGPDGDMDEVDLPEFVESAGIPDIDHGTEVYTPPANVPKDINDRIFVAFLTGGQEVPPVTTPALGAMVLLLNRAGNRLDYFLTHTVQGATVAHLHSAPAGENGAVAVALTTPLSNTTGSLKLSAAQVKDLLADRLYANVHSATNVGGEIRGQLLHPGETLFVAPLLGTEEAPPVTTTATGVASVILNAERTKIRYRIKTTDVTATAAHIHRGIAGVNGPVVYPLTPLGATIEGTQAITATDLKDLSLRQWYANVHSAANPKGELRGQLLRPGETVFAANLTGAQENPPTSSTRTGNGMVVVGMAGAQFLYVLNTDATPTLAHIHKAPGGVNGPVEVPLMPVSSQMFGVEALGPARATDLRRGLWYLNVHTAENPSGDVRGQLLRPGETLYTATLAGSNEVPPVLTMAAGGVGVILNAGRNQIRYDGAFTGVTPTLAHLHSAAVGSNGPVLYPLVLSGMAVSGIQAVTADDVVKLDSQGLYANAHSAANPMGEIRGQLIRK